jgi:hypothetical protein
MDDRLHDLDTFIIFCLVLFVRMGLCARTMIWLAGAGWYKSLQFGVPVSLLLRVFKLMEIPL